MGPLNTLGLEPGLRQLAFENQPAPDYLAIRPNWHVPGQFFSFVDAELQVFSRIGLSMEKAAKLTRDAAHAGRDFLVLRIQSTASFVPPSVDPGRYDHEGDALLGIVPQELGGYGRGVGVYYGELSHGYKTIAECDKKIDALRGGHSRNQWKVLSIWLPQDHPYGARIFRSAK